MRKIGRLVSIVVLAIGAIVVPLAIAPVVAGATSCAHVQGVRFCTSSVQDTQMVVAEFNLATALGTEGLATTTNVMFAAPSRFACLQVGRLPSRDATIYLGGTRCEWKG